MTAGDGATPRRRVLLAGVGRFAAIVAAAAGTAVALALLVGWWRGAGLAQAAAIGLYLGGAALIVVSFGRAQPFEYEGHQFDKSVSDPGEHRRWNASRAVYMAVGIAVIALGVVMEAATA